jgi:sulfur-oxidizing protein SoxZ
VTARTLIHLPKSVRRGDLVQIRVTLAHPMETGYRSDAEGRRLPRDIVRRFECRYDGELVFAADLYPAIAANPYLAFSCVATETGTLSFSWRGDNGFAHTEAVTLEVT